MQGDSTDIARARTVAPDLEPVFASVSSPPNPVVFGPLAPAERPVEPRRCGRLGNGHVSAAAHRVWVDEPHGALRFDPTWTKGDEGVPCLNGTVEPIHRDQDYEQRGSRSQAHTLSPPCVTRAAARKRTRARSVTT